MVCGIWYRGDFFLEVSFDFYLKIGSFGNIGQENEFDSFV